MDLGVNLFYLREISSELEASLCVPFHYGSGAGKKDFCTCFLYYYAVAGAHTKYDIIWCHQFSLSRSVLNWKPRYNVTATKC